MTVRPTVSTVRQLSNLIQEMEIFITQKKRTVRQLNSTRQIKSCCGKIFTLKRIQNSLAGLTNSTLEINGPVIR